MPRIVRLAAAQMGTVNRWDARAATLQRMVDLLDEAAAQGAQLVLFPELAFTTFFPRYLILDAAELEGWFEHGDITAAPNTRALFDRARLLRVDICVGFAEAAPDGNHYNSCVYYHAASGAVLAKYRKIHLPGDVDPLPGSTPDTVNQLEKRYFKPGDLGFKAFRLPLSPDLSQPQPIVGMMICNDRRWSESWRVLGLQGVEIVLCGYNTNGYAPEFWGLSADMDPAEAEQQSLFKHRIVMQAHSYTNATFSVSAARCGLDDGKFPLIAGSMIVGPEGNVLAESRSTADEIILADCDLDDCRAGRIRTFDFARHRRIEHYQLIASQVGVVEPAPLNSLASAPASDTSAAAAAAATAAAAPPASPIRILLCNPNATASMTANCIAMVQPTLPPDVEVVGFTAPAPAPTAVEGYLDGVLSAAATVRALLAPAADSADGTTAAFVDAFDAVLVACYSEHPLVKALREELSQPVVGILEASLAVARTLGSRVGVLGTGPRSRASLEDALHLYGMHTAAGVATCGLAVLELETRPQAEVCATLASTAAADLVAVRGADVVTLGCAGMAALKPAVERAVGPDVQVVDGVLAGVHHLIGLVRIRAATAKAGVYASAAARRRARGQDYL